MRLVTVHESAWRSDGRGRECLEIGPYLAHASATGEWSVRHDGPLIAEGWSQLGLDGAKGRAENDIRGHARVLMQAMTPTEGR